MSTFFSSIGHELRTPLNTIIPILVIVLQSLPKDHPSYARLSKLLTIVYNSSIHLQNVIEDALDVSRIENNKFQLFKENFDLGKAVYDVCEIMKF